MREDVKLFDPERTILDLVDRIGASDRVVRLDLVLTELLLEIPLQVVGKELEVSETSRVRRG
jgi:hypothetical protein